MRVTEIQPAAGFDEQQRLAAVRRYDLLDTTSLTRSPQTAAIYHPDPVAVLHNLNSVLLQEYDAAEPAYCTVTLAGLNAELVAGAIGGPLNGFGPGLADDTAVLALTVPAASPEVCE